VLICGNHQSKEGKILEWKNQPSKMLLDDSFLLNQLQEMANGNPKAELPSCNTFIKPTVKIDYPNQISAEDHWFTVSLLLQKNKLNIHIENDLLYCIYSLDGFQTSNNQKNEVYTQSRIELYRFAKNELG